MYTNCITSTVIKSAMIPCILWNDREAIQFCLRTCNRVEAAKARVIRIPNSLHIGHIMLSEAYYEDVKNGRWTGLTALDEPQALDFDEDGALVTPCHA